MKNQSNTVSISHFSDVLCIWAYIAQIRIDKLKAEFGSKIILNYHFCPVFGAIDVLMQKNWGHRGGVEAYNKHVLSIASKFAHVEVSSDVWLTNRPTTSISGHVVLKAIQLLEDTEKSLPGFEEFLWEIRLAFFRDALDISNYNVLIELADKSGFPVDKIDEKIRSGAAYAALEIDAQLKLEYRVNGSPTLIFNEGRQILYGNVGYRVIEANVRELLNQPEHQASWC